MQRDETATVVGESILITGELSGNEDMTVLGRVEGSIRLAKTLFVATDGIVKADVNVGNAVISGIVIGNVTASESVQITETGRLVGDLVAPRVVIVAGARVRGQVDMSGSGQAHGAQRQQMQTSSRRGGQAVHSQAQSQSERDAQSTALARAPSGRFERLGLPQRRPIPVPSTTVRRTPQAAARSSAQNEAPSRSSKTGSRESTHAHVSAAPARRSSSASKRRSSSRRRD